MQNKKLIMYSVMLRQVSRFFAFIKSAFKGKEKSVCAAKPQEEGKFTFQSKEEYERCFRAF